MTQAAIDFSKFQSGIRTFVKLTGLKEDPLEHKWIRDEFDVVDALSCIPYFVKQSARMSGKTMYAKRPYDYIEDVTKDVEEFLIVGKDPVGTALLKKKNLMMYHMTVRPILDILSHLPDHKTSIQYVDMIVESAINQVMSHEVTTTYEDGLIAKMQVRKIIEARTELAKANKNKRAKKPKADVELMS